MHLRLALTIAVRIKGFWLRHEYLSHLREEWHALWHGDNTNPFQWVDLRNMPVSKELRIGRHRNGSFAKLA